MAALKKTYNIYILLLILSLLLSGKVAISQSNYLYRKITIIFTDIPLEKALEHISEAGGFTFSYNSKNFNEKELVSLRVENKTIAKSLDQLFNKTVRYKVVGSHVILMKKNPPKSEPSMYKPNEYLITGYVIDSRTGEKIVEATVYEVDGRIVSLSNSEGYYSLTIPSDKELRGLSYSKRGYLDTVIIIETATVQNLNIYLNPDLLTLNMIESKPVNLKLSDFHNRQVVDLLVPNESKTISDNLEIHENRMAQVSLIPYLGTNRKLSGSVDNTFSFNILSGYSGGINGFELGGLLNIVRRNVNGSQISGFANFVGGDTRYFQLAGFFNKNTGSIYGAQVAGFNNVVLDSINGVQLAGFQNTLHGKMNGAQISGFNNVTTQNVDGIQLTGFINVALKDVELAQFAGFANYCDNVNGGQVAGFSNIAKGDVNWGQASGFANYGKSVKGLQVTGFANVSANEVTGGQLAGFGNYGKTGGKFQISGYANIATEEIKGVQLTAFLNYAKKVKGLQLATINICDTIEDGIPIGMFSYVKKGYHKFEVFADEIFYANVAFKTGVKKFYNIFKAGYGSGNFYTGYGIGTLFNLNKKLDVSLDLSTNVVRKKNDEFGSLNKLSASLDINIIKRLTVFVGPTINFLIIDESPDNKYDVAPYSLYDGETFSGSQTNFWIGGILGVRF